MLLAQSKDGSYIDAALLAKKKKRERPRLHCPGCQSPVLLKAGEQKIAHFAHCKGTTCQTYSEGETVEHLQGKRLLLQFVSSATIEAYLPELKQRPDLLADKRALEFQCSPLPFSRFQERTLGYIQAQYQPIWILGSKLQPKRHWTHFQKACCQLNSATTFYSFGLDVSQEKLLCYRGMQWSYPVGYTWQVYSKTPAHQWKFERAVCQSLHTTESYPHWLQRQLMQLNPTFLTLQQKVYELGLSIFSLPNWCYSPSRYGFLFTHELLVLRAYFCYWSTFDDWLHACQKTNLLEGWPYLDCEQLCVELYQECQQLAKYMKK